MTKTKNKRKISKNKTIKHKSVRVLSNFESGNIIFKKHQNNIIDLEIREEPYPRNTKRKYKNWFYFKTKNLHSKTTFNIHKLRNYFNDWKGFNVCYSYDNQTWKRIKTKYNNNKKKISWSINPKKSTVWFAYYPPYPFSKLRKIIPNMEVIGYSGDKRPIYMKKIGNGPKRIWLISGQHSGETINSWMLKGFLKRLMERKSEIKNKFTFYIIPCANPDGNVRGHWYVTKQGYNLNRDWMNTKSPEVKCIKKQMNKHGYDLVFDLHGDEGCKNHFFANSFKCKHPMHDGIITKLKQINKHFQLDNYYSDQYMKGARETLDDFTRGITVEGCMKHPLRNHKTLQDEPLKIGKNLFDVISRI